MSQAAREQQGDASPSMFEALGQLNYYFRWMAFSALPQVLGPTRWAVGRCIVDLDHQTLGLSDRRDKRHPEIFRVPQRDISAMTGVCPRAVRNAINDLKHSKLLSHYAPGGGRQWGAGGTWCAFAVNRATIKELALYALPRTMPVHGGIRGKRANELPAVGIQVYGWRDRDPLIIPTQKLFVAAHVGDDLGEPDPQEVARIYGL